MSYGLPVRISGQPLEVTTVKRNALRSTFHLSFSAPFQVDVPANERWVIESLICHVVVSGVNLSLSRYLHYYHIRDSTQIYECATALPASSVTAAVFSPHLPNLTDIYSPGVPLATRTILPDLMPSDHLTLASQLDVSDSFSAELFYRVVSDG